MVSKPRAKSASSDAASTRKKPGKVARPADRKSDRLILRAHPDLVDVIDLRARERNLTRSAYIADVLVAWVHADPRNPRLTAGGRMISLPHTPRELRDVEPHKFAERWRKFADAYLAMFGHAPPAAWLEDDRNFWPPFDVPAAGTPRGIDRDREQRAVTEDAIDKFLAGRARSSKPE